MNKYKKLDLLLNIILVISTTIAIGMYFNGTVDVLGSTGAQCFMYFTTDSNVIAAITSIMMIYYLIKEQPIPRILSILKFATTVAVSITLLVVIFFIAPMAYIKGGIHSVILCYSGNIFVLHLSSPVLAIISTLFLEKETKLTFKECLFAYIPYILYGLTYLLMVMVLKVWKDFYGFTFGMNIMIIPLVIIVMVSFVTGLIYLEMKIKNN